MTTEEFRSALIEAGLLQAAGVDGLYHRSFQFERIVRGVEGYASRAGNETQSRQLFFAPVMAQSTLVQTDYVTSFPDLMGVISSFAGREAELRSFLDAASTGGDWQRLLSPTDVVLCSAACHNIYPTLAGAQLPDGGLLFEIQGVCFRHEPSRDPARMQSFRMHEFVYVGTAHGALEHRERWLQRGVALLEALELSTAVVEANDPFFGRAGRLLAAGQRERALKFEVVAPISSDVPGAISSGNYHEDHFGLAFDLTASDGTVAHSACFAFGLERISLALLFRHGTDVDRWPSRVRELLALPFEGLGVGTS